MSLFDLPAPPPPREPEPVSEPQPAGRCRRCKRLIRDPVSLGYQIGPDCRHRLGIDPPKKPPRIGVRWTGPVKDQIELLKINEGEEMTTTTAEPEAKQCWVLVYSSGLEVDTGDGVQHFPSEDEAAEEAPKWSLHHLGVPAPRQLDQPCFEISGCACCEDSFSDAYSGTHFDSRADAEKSAEDAGWKLAEDGTATCGECLSDPECQAEAAKVGEGQ